jgi:hypothetical protein
MVLYSYIILRYIIRNIIPYYVTTFVDKIESGLKSLLVNRWLR